MHCCASTAGTLLPHLMWIPALLVGAAIAPLLLARHLVPRSGLILHCAVAGAALTCMAVAVPVALHLAQAPITAPSLAFAYGAVALLSGGGLMLRRLPLLPRVAAEDVPGFWWLFLGFAVLVAPYTPLAGIDTYKWQDHASSVAVEQAIPWLIHPLSLFGFTPRAYPSAYPLLLGSVEIVGKLGVEGGFFVASLLVGLTGLASAYVLGLRVFGSRAGAGGLAAFYVFSPVFMRYAHWATGRGLCLALLPLFLCTLLDLPRLRAWVPAAALALLLALSHKAGLIAAVALPLLMLGAPLIPSLGRRLFLLAALAPLLVLAVLVAPQHAAGFVRYTLTRFAWMVPAAAALFLAGPMASMDPWRRFLPAALLLLPFAFTADMYGAMLWLPFLALAATSAVLWLRRRWPQADRPVVITAALLTAAAAVGVVAERGADALPRRVRAAAAFIESHDPRGPLIVEAPGRMRTRAQAYLSGCPRYTVLTGADARVVFPAPPPWQGEPAALAKAWIDYLRTAVGLSEAATDWYGKNPRRYCIIVDGAGDRPTPSRTLYARDGVEVLVPNAQEDPPRPEPGAAK